MALIVQKFGGDALGDKGKGKTADESDLAGASLIIEKFQRVAKIALESQKKGNEVAVVVSAMGDATNRLLRMASALSPEPPARELDMLMTTGEQQSIALLAIAVQALGGKSLSFTGPQVGIVTDQAHGRSRIKEINCERLREVLSQGYIPIVAGFQGASEEFEITTLGRGGSDISAVALAAALEADVCEFYKDVDGIFTTDPRVCGSAKKIDRISYDEMLELASLGAGVLHSRSVEFAKNYNIPLHVRSFLHDEPGTLVTPEDEHMEDVVVSGVAFKRDESKISLIGVPDRPGVAARLFSAIGEADIVVDVIVQSVGHEKDINDISFTVGHDDYKRAVELTNRIAAEIGCNRVEVDESIAKVSVVGVGMKSHSKLASRMLEALSAAGVNIQMISTSEIKITVVVDETEVDKAVVAVHKAFEDQSDFKTIDETNK